MKEPQRPRANAQGQHPHHAAAHFGWDAHQDQGRLHRSEKPSAQPNQQQADRTRKHPLHLGKTQHHDEIKQHAIGVQTTIVLQLAVGDDVERTEQCSCALDTDQQANGQGTQTEYFLADHRDHREEGNAPKIEDDGDRKDSCQQAVRAEQVQGVSQQHFQAGGFLDVNVRVCTNLQ